MKLKKVLGVLSVLVLSILVFSGCGKKEQGKSGEGVEEIRVAWWGGDSRNEVIQEALKKFEEDNPTIKIKAEFSGYGGYEQKLTTQLSGGTAPDVVRLDSMWVENFKNQLLDLSELSDQVGMNNFTDNQLESITIDGKVLGLPLSTNYRPLYYNKTLLDENGIDAPKSWEAVIAMRDKLPEDVYPLSLGVLPKEVTPMVFMQIMSQKTGNAYGNEENELLYDEEDFKDALTFYQELVEKKIIPSKKIIDNSGIVDGAPNPNIVDGKWACFWEWTANTTVMEAQLAEKGYEMAMAGFLSLENEKSTGVYTKPSMVYSIPTSSKHQEAAAKVINYLMNDPEAAKIQKTENGVPDSESAREVLEEEGLIPDITLEAMSLGSEKEDSRLAYGYRWQRARLNDIMLDVITSLDYGEMTVDEAAKELYDAFSEESGDFSR